MSDGARTGRRLIGAALAVAALLGTTDSTAQTPPPGSAGAPAAASAAPVGSSADLEQLRERAAAYWAARVAGDANKQWELLEPRGRGRTTPTEYAMERGAVKYLGYQVEDAAVDGYFGTVKVRLLVQPLLAAPGRNLTPPGAFVLPDKWVRVQGVWYHVLEDESTGKAGPGGASR
jgi:hypothetical protein